MNFSPQLIYIEYSVKDKDYTKKILSNFPDTPKEYIKDIKDLLKKSKGKLNTFDKRTQPLLLAKQRGAFLEKCPGTKEHICCNYYTLNIAVGCPFDCTYCFLQSYTTNPFYTVYVNLEDMFAEIKQKATANKQIRIGTGEFTDSIALEKYTGFIRDYVPKILKLNPGLVLELKTKSADIEFMEKLGWPKQIVLAWSLNPQNIINSDERYTDNLSQRINAASRAISYGYRIAFHFDPIIYGRGWEQKYAEIIVELKQKIPPEKIAWISLGTLRFTPGLKPIVEEKFPESKIIYGEFFPGPDHKMRYPEALRVQVYQTMLALLSAYGQNLPVYLCMESPAIWQKVFGSKPGELSRLQGLFS